MQTVNSIPQRTSATERLRALDGLRGIAALSVLAFHVTQLNPAVGTYVAGGDAPRLFSGAWWISSSPLRVFSLGDEAVFVFFILSGLVLTLPVVRAISFDWLQFSAARVLRLFLPTLASLIFAYLLVSLVARSHSPGLSPWLAEPYNPLTVSWQMLLANSDLIFGDSSLNGPTWTIRWELIFSFLLPTFIGLTATILRSWWLASLAAGASVTIGLLTGQPGLVYLPILFVGVIIAFHLDQLKRANARFEQDHPTAQRLTKTLAIVMALILLLAYVLLKPYIDPAGIVAVASRVLSILGAVLVVLLVAVEQADGGWLWWGPIQWLGRVSFSLYLVHLPIVATLGFLLGGQNWALAGALAVIASLVGATLFSAIVERPSHRIARAFGRWTSSRVWQIRAEGSQ